MSKNIVAYVDGGCFNNQNAAKRKAYGSFAVYDNKDFMYSSPRLDFGSDTNNQAEYKALIKCLKWIRKHVQLGSDVTVWTDSSLMVNQMNGMWGVKSENMQKLKADADVIMQKLDKRLKSISIRWVNNLKIKEILGH